ncbi:cell surface protein [Pyxidicoccus fallax]|uniref:Cell surface protein n=1 Tax=Pyxidicoccus fallax TaxID=394095 RepID=A0A848LYQ0_9BACT|nr:cell surface protein [Pyxidicoccus fallax]NMO22759.1 cell surface protein [Pyxidicoccus fallax]NPC86308.1 cell surface protein [Pyxidicoccus fallax]
MSPLRSSLRPWGAALAALLSLAACGDEEEGPTTPPVDAGTNMPGADSGTDAGTDAGTDGGTPRPSDPYADEVVAFTPGDGAGFGQDRFPGVVLGPPSGVGPDNGSLDVLSLGREGSITLRFTDVGVVDGPGVDLLVFENAFAQPGGRTFSETGRVAVSEDGTTWRDFPCAAQDADAGYPGCAGVRTVQANPANGVSATDPAVAGGDGFDLATVGLSRARYIRITDSGANGYGGTSGGFDLDAVAVVNGEPLPGASP